MKRILITGANSYIGTSVERYLLQWPEAYSVDTLDMVDGSWREKSFSGYDVVFHVAGIAHQDSGSITEERKRLYYQVNTDLAIETAKKARAEGVRQFIFMSSISIYGASVRMGIQKLITSQTVPVPANAYGDSKLQAEQGILPLQNDAFLVCVLRPPMIYGPGCRGNYPLLSKAALRLPVFPDIRNQRSLLYIGNLCAFIRHAVDRPLSGIQFPQNAGYAGTSQLVGLIAAAHGRKVYMTRLFNPALRLLSAFSPFISKVFGDFVVDPALTAGSGFVPPVDLAQSIKESEGQ